MEPQDRDVRQYDVLHLFKYIIMSYNVRHNTWCKTKKYIDKVLGLTPFRKPALSTLPAKP